MARALVREARAWRNGFRKNVLVNELGGWAGTPLALRTALLRSYGVRLGEGVTIFPGCWFGGNNISIGARTFINRGCLFDNSERISLGERCAIGPGTKFLTGTHEIGPSDHRARGWNASPIKVGDGTWLGASVLVLPGVSIAGGCVVAAGAVVTEDCAADGLYGGVPARRLRDLAVENLVETPEKDLARS